ncbi:hypothetical protein [Roseateles sp.]|uniref:hypothetical protein n=1 Tax=Roseateles sp. TaxID=1971397 RepID=UPI003D0CBAAA
MTAPLSKSIAKPLLRLMWIGVLAAWVVYGVYIYNFAPGSWFTLSAKPDDWGVFGDYVGGILNPFFSFLAFIGVVITVVLQAKQLDIARDQANFEEIQRVLSSLSARVDSLLSAGPTLTTRGIQDLSSPPQSVFELVSALGTLHLNRPPKDDTDWLRTHAIETRLQELEKAISGQLTVLCIELEALAWTLGRYAADGGSTTVVEFYKYRYRAVLVWLDAIGRLEAHGQVQSVFAPKESRKYMVNEPPSQPAADTRQST